MYKIFADGELIYDSTLDEYHIGSGEVTLEAGKSGSFVFSLYPDHPHYDRFVELRTVVTVYKDDRIVFRGRVLNTRVDYWNNLELTCEGEMGFLQDSIIRPYSFNGTPADLFTRLITEHNAQVDAFKRFKVGMVTVVDNNGYIARSNIEHETALSNLTSRLLEDATGGVFYITHGDDGRDEVPTIHYLADYTKVATQGIEFGVNLKDYAKTVDAAELATAIIPLGVKPDGIDVRLGIRGVNGGKDYVYSPAAQALRGWVFQPVIWEDVTDPNILLAKARDYVERVINVNITVELTAVDLHLLDRSVESYRVCEYIPVSSAPHNFAATLLCHKQTMNLLHPENDTVVLGHSRAAFTSTTSKAVTGQIKKLATVVSSASSAASAANSAAAQLAERVAILEQGGGGSAGENGATFFPAVSADGTLTWTNDGDLPNPNPVNIMGPEGPEGPQGPEGPPGPAGGGADVTPLTNAEIWAIIGYVPIITVDITASNISEYFTVTNASYYFVGNGGTFTTNNGGVGSSTAKTTLKALFDMEIKFTYSYSSESNYDKFTLKVGSTTVENAVSGSTTVKQYSGKITAGTELMFQYTKDGGADSNDDRCTFSDMTVKGKF